MPTTVEAIYEDGKLIPEHPLPFPDKARVRVTIESEAVAVDWLDMQVHPLPLATADFERLTEALREPPRNLPRLRELLKEPGKFGNA